MEGEAGILQQWIEFVAVEGGGIEPRERIGRRQHEGVEAEPDQSLHCQHSCPERGRQPVTEARDRRAEHR